MFSIRSQPPLTVCSTGRPPPRSAQPAVIARAGHDLKNGRRSLALPVIKRIKFGHLAKRDTILSSTCESTGGTPGSSEPESAGRSQQLMQVRTHSS